MWPPATTVSEGCSFSFQSIWDICDKNFLFWLIERVLILFSIINLFLPILAFWRGRPPWKQNSPVFSPPLHSRLPSPPFCPGSSHHSRTTPGNLYSKCSWWSSYSHILFYIWWTGPVLFVFYAYSASSFWQFPIRSYNVILNHQAINSPDLSSFLLFSKSSCFFIKPSKRWILHNL